MGNRTEPQPSPGVTVTQGHKPELDLSEAQWRSGSKGHGDVEVAFVEGFVVMRDAARPERSELVFTPGEWHGFMLKARSGEFDLT